MSREAKGKDRIPQPERYRWLTTVITTGLLALAPLTAGAEVDHRVHAVAAGGVWPVPNAGGHGIVIVDWQVLQAPGQGRFRLNLNTDTLRLTYDDVCFGAVCLGAQVAGQALFAGLLTDYYRRGKRVSDLEFEASYAAASVFADFKLPSSVFARYTVTGRRWFFSELGGGGRPPAEAWVGEQELGLTYWGFEHDPSLSEPHRLFARVRGLGMGVQLSLHLRSDDRAWGESEGSPNRRNDPDFAIWRIRQWARFGHQLNCRVRLQVEERFAWGFGEDDLTRDRLGGLNPYVTPIGGVPWAGFLSERYLAGRVSAHVRVYEQFEVGAFFDAAAMQDILRDDSERLGGAVGAGVFLDARWGRWQVDVWAAYAPGLAWGLEDHYLAGFLSAGYRFL